jgi:YD repeat-containing protein
LTWSDTNVFGAGVGNLLRITSPNGRWIAFTYDTNSPNRITDATDNIGRTVHYTYDGNGHLSTVTDPAGNVTTYTWDANHRMTTVKDGRNIVYLTNHYDASGRVDKQTLADPAAFYSFAYTTNGGGNITRAEVTNPRGYTKQLNYNPDHYLTSQVEALNQPEARTTTITRLPVSNLVSAVVHALVVEGSLRKTEYTYDDFGHVQTVKRLANTPNPVTTTFTYEPAFFQLASVTDPLLHTWTINYDGQGKMLGATDPLSHQTTTVMNSQGQVRASLMHCNTPGNLSTRAATCCRQSILWERRRRVLLTPADSSEASRIRSAV